MDQIDIDRFADHFFGYRYTPEWSGSILSRTKRVVYRFIDGSDLGSHAVLHETLYRIQKWMR